MSDLDKLRKAVGGLHQSKFPKSTEVTLSLDAILDRSEETRSLNQKHVELLAESIAAIGLIEPLVTDNQGRLLAGGHRKAAIALLRQRNPPAFADKFPNNQVPVRIMAFDASERPDLALVIETSENEQRRDYTPAEVRAIADRLRKAGYRDEPGRPKKGEKQLRPALTLIFGKSIATVRRYLNEPDQKTRSDERVSSELLRRSLRNLRKWQQTQDSQAAQAKNIDRAIKLIEKVLKDEPDS